MTDKQRTEKVTIGREKVEELTDYIEKLLKQQRLEIMKMLEGMMFHKQTMKRLEKQRQTRNQTLLQAIQRINELGGDS